ncbi:MAG: hypothetical protein SGILL_000636 [Bacillariaceae sp.]
MQASQFSSEGFDLDALGDNRNGAGNGSSGHNNTNNDEQDVVYEIGGGVTTVPTVAEKEGENNSADHPLDPLTPLQVADQWKQKGNEEFKKKNFLEAYDLYTEAIEACPCPIRAEEILRQRDEFNAAEREKARQRMDEETRRGKKSAPSSQEDAGDKEKEEQKEGPAVFVLPTYDHSDKLAVYYCNRAATSMYMERYNEAIEDSDIAILLNSRYTKAYTRRSVAFEKTERTEEALRDAKRALELEPSNTALRKSVLRLQKIEDERLETLKVRQGGGADDTLTLTTRTRHLTHGLLHHLLQEETMSKLKDLGNSLLGNFGLSLDNFQTVQDPNTGSYSISFNQNQS